MHSWYDDPAWPYWDELYRAQDYITRMVYRFSLCRLISKEKYGTLRYEFIFPPGGSIRLYCGIDKYLTIFGYKVIKKDVTIEYTIQRIIWSQTYLYKLWHNYGKVVALFFIKRAAKKFPLVSEEILDDLWDGRLCI